MAWNRIVLDKEDKVGSLKGIDFVFYWQEVMPRAANDKIYNRTKLAWQLWVEADPELVHTAIKGVYGGSFRISVDGTLKIDTEEAQRKEFWFKELGYEFQLCACDSTSLITVNHDASGNYSGVFSRLRMQAIYALLAAGKEDDSSGSVEALNVPIEVTPIPQIGYLKASTKDYTENDNIKIDYKVLCDLANVEKLEACLSVTGANDDVPYREVPIYTHYVNGSGSGYYTFELSEEDRIALYPATAETVFGVIRAYLKTTMKDGSVYWDFIDIDYELVEDYEPSIEPTVVDVNPVTLAVTGDENILVRYVSNAYYQMNETTRKGAYGDIYKITNGANVIEGSGTGIIEAVESNDFDFKFTDSRGFNAKASISVGLIPYYKPTCNQKISMAFSGLKEASATVNISGTYYHKWFSSSVKNTLKVYIRHTQNDGSMGDWFEVTSFAALETDGERYSINFNITGLEYDRLYTYESKAVDLVAEGLSSEYATRATPLFDWGKEDFNFNVPVTASNSLEVTGDLKVNGGKVHGAYILYDTRSNGNITLEDDIANYDYIEIFYNNNNERGSGSLKVETAGVTNTLTITLSLIESSHVNKQLEEAGAYNKTNIRSATYYLKGKAMTLDDLDFGIVYLSDTKITYDTSKNYIYVTKVLGYK